ncbi:DUF2357 domain-containing protein [Cupriavidus lacunae]|nr:DUF2357 domain-containing protein [Cupriavidus lacunae]
MAEVPCYLTIRPAANSEAEQVTVHVGEVGTGFCEGISYLINVHGVDSCRLLLDDVELPKTSDGCFAWAPNFFAGRVTAVVLAASGQEYAFQFDVSPTPQKLGAEQFDAMLSEIRDFDTTLLVGASAAAIGFGRQGRPGNFEALVQLARLREHGSSFLAAVHEIARVPQRFLRSASQAVPLSRIRRLVPSALRDHRLASLATGLSNDDASLESLTVLSQAPALTVDTPANRTMLALIKRFQAVVRSLAEKTATLSLGGSVEDQAQRKDRRLEVLRQFAESVEKLLALPPFAEISRAETTAAGLTQISAHPSYSRAYRKGTDALRTAVEGEDTQDLLQVSPSWGVYEAWCFVRLVSILRDVTGCTLQLCESSVAAADLAMSGILSDGRRLDLLFQAVFPSESPSGGRCACSLSRERRPDVVLAVTQGADRRFIVFDSKYRSGRENTLDAMASAHIYHDALRLGAHSPELVLLLLPGQSAVPSLEAADFWRTNEVGTLSEFSIDAKGLNRCEQAIFDWVAPYTHLQPKFAAASV